MSKDYPTSFLDEDFLLENKYSKILYHDFAAFLPIIDYHNHLPPDQIAANRIFENITKIWLAGDHYKWRAMRTLGIQEQYITGDASDLEKFEKWSETVPYTLRNPLYHWTHMELSRYYGINQLLGPSNGTRLYHQCSELTNSSDFSTRRLLERMNVEVVCTTDDPADSLEHHQAFSTESEKFKMFPAFRPDKAFAIDQPGYWAYLEKLGISSGVDIVDYPALLEALRKRIDFFHLNQCRLSDHGLERLYWFEAYKHDEARIFQKSKEGKPLEAEEAAYFKYAVLLQLCHMYHEKGWTQQFHLGALRNNNSRILAKLGPDTGFDSIGDFSQAQALSKFLNELDNTDQLTKTVLYNLNPSDNEVFATMVGNFNDGSVKGKIQFGSGWWFLDQKDGMEAQINTLSNMGLISCFIGMLTDSRSFLSFPRHEYFRRILCNLFGKDMQNGLLPQDEDWIGKIVQDICYFNAKNFFGFHNA
ncbi:Uronate isomerase [Mariniradius saccharolyticus AK6]|uniref:Uronate isomerase n=1 Tax=Mariniradius saccharolyticus AK6 TaxID=1239962 RepID=M7XBH4_9BACT|nr:glucuronate isomerase [Mariniradius saccharolyticus]EMS31938.1 Uronate isomerase [Mariniradius saccharolyticus AK6]